jgi:hypothetical protein
MARDDRSGRPHSPGIRDDGPWNCRDGALLGELGPQPFVVEGEDLDVLGKRVDGPEKVGDLFVAGATCFAEFALELADVFAQGRGNVGTAGAFVDALPERLQGLGGPVCGRP